ncbi:MAG: UvrD-helicase domain-containing protein [bacterium]|nr:UvrD-helicase domain-containing protein [bacterium]
MNHLEGLNTAQKEAVLHTQGPLLVLAGAGAGKTRVIAHRVAEIVRRGAAPEEILAITFTNKAAGEMRNRIQGETSRFAAQGSPRFRLNTPFVSTFHSLGLLMIKENAKLLGFTRAPTIWDRADSLREIKVALKQSGAEDIEARAALSLISKQKGHGITAAEFGVGAENFRERAIATAWLAYERALHKESAVDFDDLLLRAMHLLRDHSNVRERYQQRWKYIHIDEYQDTNFVQAQLAELLVGDAKNICVVGDIDQTIYGWRGAEIANILSFEKKFPGAKTVLLEENYRSTKNILAAANDIISKNNNRVEKNLYTKNQDGEALSLYQAFDELDEAQFIVRKIQELRAGETCGNFPQVKPAEPAEPRDFAVLYRANFQSRAIEEKLLTAGIPYQVLGTRFFERKEVKDALAFVRCALRSEGEEGGADLVRVVNVPPRGIGKVTVLKILAGRERELPGAMRGKVAILRSLLRRIQEVTVTLPPSEVVRFVIVESGMEGVFKEDKIEGGERLENLRELVSLASRYDGYPKETALESFLESVALQSDQDELKDEQNAVRLMTVHAAKGLEFSVVFITGLEEGLFPYARDPSTSLRAGDEDADKEEERRLCYVALTRAKQKVFLSYASYRTVFGSKNATLPSQFISDISDHLLVWESPERLGKTIYLD